MNTQNQHIYRDPILWWNQAANIVRAIVWGGFWWTISTGSLSIVLFWIFLQEPEITSHSKDGLIALFTETVELCAKINLIIIFYMAIFHKIENVFHLECQRQISKKLEVEKEVRICRTLVSQRLEKTEGKN